MMSAIYVNKYLVVCYLVLILVINAVADISIDYYFGNYERLRSSESLGDCKSEEMINNCHQKCGPQHACLLGQCFCVKANSPPEENLDEVFALENVGGEDTGSESYEEDEEKEEESQFPETNSDDEKLAARPTLRHHIAHFCPNLRIARVCIRKCMKLAKPAFCGKDHVCYCGHQYDFPGKEPKLKASDVYGQFRDLYEKYFGPKTSKLKKVKKHNDIALKTRNGY